MKPALWISVVYMAFLEDGWENAVYRHLNAFFSRDCDLTRITSLLPITKCIPSFSVHNKSHKGMQTDMLTNVYSMQTTQLLKQYSHSLHLPHIRWERYCSPELRFLSIYKTRSMSIKKLF